MLALAAASAVIGGILFTYYAVRRGTSKRICAPALVATTRAEREAARKEGLGPLFPIIDPDSSCIQLERDRLDFERTGECTSFVMDDVPCKCGEARWTGKDSPKRCPTAPMSCEMRGEVDRRNDGPRRHLGLGCPSEDDWTLREARGQ